MSGTELTPKTFDTLALQRGGSRSQIIWTLPAIGRRIGASADFVRDTLAKAEGTPVRTMGGRFYALEDDLLDFMRSEKNRPL